MKTDLSVQDNCSLRANAARHVMRITAIGGQETVNWFSDYVYWARPKGYSRPTSLQPFSKFDPCSFFLLMFI